MAHGHDEVLADEHVDLAGLDGVPLVDVPERLEDQEQGVVVALQLGPLVGRRRPRRPGGAGRTPIATSSSSASLGSWRPTQTKSPSPVAIVAARGARGARSRPGPGRPLRYSALSTITPEASPTTLADMATVILVRHGRTTANATGVLAGRLAGVQLDETGHGQATRVGAAAGRSAARRDREQPPRALPADGEGDPRRAGRAAHDLARPRDHRVRLRRVAGPGPARDLAKEKLWSTVQTQPSAAAFPGGESMGAMQARAVSAVRRRDAALEAEHGPGAIWVAVSHGDIIKSVLADALGMHLDLFQRISVDPASVSIVRYTPTGPTCSPPTPTRATWRGWRRRRSRSGRRARPPVDAGSAAGRAPTTCGRRSARP